MSATMIDKLTIEMPSEPVYDISSLGEGIALRSRKTVELTPEYASKFLNYNEFRVGDIKVDRNLGEAHVIHLAREMLAGNFRWEQVNLVLAELDGQLIRMNGQHCSWARLYADEQGLDKKTRSPVQLMTYVCKTEEDARRLYASLDRGRPRGSATVVNSHLLGTEEFEGMPAPVLRAIAAGISVWLWENINTRALHGGDDRAYLLLRDHLKVAQIVAEFLKDTPKKKFGHLIRGPVVGAMFATFDKDHKSAWAFWESVKDGLDLSSDKDPRYRLREWLMKAALSKTLKAPLGTIFVGNEEMYRTCLAYWNAHRSGKTIKRLHLNPGSDRPEVL